MLAVKVSFEVNIIMPFSGVKLEIGGAVETYWKSLAMPVPGGSGAKLLSPRPPQHGRALGSAQTSPTNPTLATASGHSLTHSSVTGSYIYVTVQVTRDLHPVAFADWRGTRRWSVRSERRSSQDSSEPIMLPRNVRMCHSFTEKEGGT